MLIVSFANPAEADAQAARYPQGLSRPLPGLLVWHDNDRWTGVPAPLLGLQGSIVDRRTGRLLPAAAVADAIAGQGDHALDDWAPAFRIAWTSGNAAHVAADHCGLGHWYGWSGDGMAAISDHATTIARHFGLDVDTTALGGLALIGSMVGLDSAIAGVSKIGAGQIAALEAGRLTLRAMAAPGRFAAPENAIPATMTRLLATHPDAEIELSGGWDSRLMLVGLPRAARRGMQGFTIGTEDDPDVIIARRLAADGGMVHDIVDLSGLEALSAADFNARIVDAAVRDDFGGNPLDRLGINLINDTRPPRPRFSGQNGEILRGFYYPGQPLDAPASPALAARVINWRIISNDLVAPAMFDPAWLAATRASVTARLEHQLLDGADKWGDALDRFYLTQRMQRWCGAAVSATLGRRPVLMPYFDPDVLALAAATPTSLKAESRFAAQEIVRLDARLAAIPLASHLVPAEIARGGLAGRVALARQFVGKAGAKVVQQLARRDVATSRSIAASTLAMRHDLPARIDIDALDRLKIFAPGALEAFQKGETGMTRSTMGFVLNADCLLKRLAEPLQ
jgi:asparagine synthase (glutamine-hydrolysing)